MKYVHTYPHVIGTELDRLNNLPGSYSSNMGVDLLVTISDLLVYLLVSHQCSVSVAKINILTS